MNLQITLTYFMDFCLGLTGVLICARMAKTFHLKYLYYYLYFLVTLYITAMYGDVPENFQLFAVSDSHLLVMVGGILAALLGTPMIVTSIYMFALLITGMLDRKLTKPFKIAYFIFSSAIFTGQVILTANYFHTNHARFIMIFLGYSMKLYIGLFLMIIIYLFIKAGKIPDPGQGKALRIFGVLHAAAFLYIMVFTLGIEPVVSFLPVSRFLFILFAVQLLPLLYWKRFLKRRQAEFVPTGAEVTGEQWNDLIPFISGKKISKREIEIIRLLLKGKSNKEIEDELFISIHTVRNHVYNIYQKLGVKNRVELVNLIHNSTTGKPAAQ